MRDLTPFRGVRAQNILTDLQHPRFVLVALNLRDRQAFDMYRIDLETGAVTLEATNPGDVLTWATDNDFVIRGATALVGKSGNSIVRVRDAVDQPWRDLVVMPFESALFSGQVVGGSLIAGFDPDGKSLVIQSALESDKGALVRVSLRDGRRLEVLAQDPQADVANGGLGDGPSVLRDPVTDVIQAVEFDYSAPRWVFLDPKIKADFETIGQLLVEHHGALAPARRRLRSRREIEPRSLAALSRRQDSRSLAHRAGPERSAGHDLEREWNGEGLREAKREVIYVLYPDEGHGFARPENNRDFYGRVEEFLAKHLGGRAEPWKKVEGATAELR
ncbi:MAG: hypothetical protein H0V54_12445 [Chthoniobacterales bacterium]|nr:hypothetical protein [Chthoniobacterales bacterium]